MVWRGAEARLLPSSATKLSHPDGGVIVAGLLCTEVHLCEYDLSEKGRFSQILCTFVPLSTSQSPS